MSEQMDLFGKPPPYARGSDTSEAAASSVTELTGKWRTMVYELIAKRKDYGATCDECEVELARRHQNISARIWELRHQGFIVDSERRRLTRSGRRAVVWVAK